LDLERGRQDLYYRLNVLNLRIPPLRERLEDIPALAQSLAIRIAARMKVDEKKFDEGLLEKLKLYSWPGNVRELENTIERAINLAGDDPILRAKYIELGAPEAGMDASEPFETASVRSLNEVEQEMIRRAIAFHNGNINKAAISLGISRNTLYRKMKEYEAGSSVSSPCA
jgi:DNA-binding NtrC family response regulator